MGQIKKGGEFLRLLIGLPCYDKVEPETTMCLMLAVRRFPATWEIPNDFDIKIKTGAYVHFHREELTVVGYEKRFTHLMMIDADLQFPPDGIERLIAHNADIAYATYNRKNRDFQDRLKNPAGFMLLKLEAVQKIPFPRFECPIGIGEDNYFFDKARVAGLNIVRDDSIEIGHIGKRMY